MKHSATWTVRLLFAVTLCGTAQEPQSLFQKGNEAYRNGDFTSSIEAYEEIAHGGFESAEVYFNLGNAYYRAGKIGKAILSYERATRLDPFDDDIEHNLALARVHTVDRIDPLPEFFFVTWMRAANASIPQPMTISIFTSAWVLVFLSLIALFLVRNITIMRIARSLFLASSVVSVLFGVFLFVQSAAFTEENMAVIQSSTVTAKASPDETAVDAFVIHEGLKVTVSDALDAWVKVTLPDGKVGWVEGNVLELI